MTSAPGSTAASPNALDSVAALKVDRGLLVSAAGRPQAAKMLEASVASWKSVGITTVAEGVDQPSFWHSRRPPAASLVLSPSNPLARWSARAEGAVQAARAQRAVALATAPAPVAASGAHADQPIAGLYKRLLGEGTSISRPRDLRRAGGGGPGQSRQGEARLCSAQAEDIKPDRTTELTALTALVVPAWPTVIRSTAPLRAVASTSRCSVTWQAPWIRSRQGSRRLLDPTRMRAVLTAGMQSSNGAFLGHMKDGGRMSHSMVQASNLVPDGGKVAAEFTEMASSERQELLPVKRQGGAGVALQERVLRSLSDRMSELDRLKPIHRTTLQHQECAEMMIENDYGLDLECLA
ncbi:unnamed protein product [Hyaloperonospora brassicae]|uniref:Uncharacterized protein n=1 Tax=Hyaloperonospora brassicae TaxID=162125 RepID=A0AAV0TTR0_HYABA|nr:unnamed protein product [Hyaloperonospora brassicae]